MTLYTYAQGDLLDKPNTYQYSKYHGNQFLTDWQQHRQEIMSELGEPQTPVWAAEAEPIPDKPPYRLDILLKHMPDDYKLLKTLIKKFEVTKKLYREYDQNFKPVDKSAYQDLSLYIRMAEVVEQAYSQTSDLMYLNVFLKLMDTLISRRKDLSEQEKKRLCWLIIQENKHVEATGV